MSPLKSLLWFCLPLALIPALLAWPLWLLASIGWAIARCFRPAGVKATERNRAIAAANARRHRIRTVVQMQLAAQGLPDTPENRARVAMSLNRKSR
ncbi:hypothetical protein LBMAG40_12990 [Cyanobium sp.]|nr:hypothetical protein LBMAG40_12990 [Cyanobium sp.]